MSHPLYGDWPEALEEGARNNDQTPLRAFADWLGDNGMYGHEELIRQHLEGSAYPTGISYDSPDIKQSSGILIGPPALRSSSREHNWVSLRIPHKKGYTLFESRYLTYESARKLHTAIKEEQGEHYKG